MTGPEWTARLDCGHHARHLQSRPAVGGWITCPDGRCQGQRRMTAVAAVTPVPAPGQATTQLPLWDGEAA